MKIKFIKNGFSILSFACLFLFFSCSQHTNNTIRIGILEGPSAISFIQLLDNQTTVKGKRIEVIVKSEPLQIQAMMMQDDLDFAILPTIMAVNLFNKGVDYRLLACPIWGTLYVLSNNSSIQTLDDLTNQTVAVFGQGATPDILLKHLLDIKQIDSININYSYSGNNDVAIALLHKKINTAVVSEPMVSYLLSKEANIHIVTKLDCEDFVDNIDTDIFVQTAFIVNNKFIQENEDYINPVCDAYARSCNFINEQPLDAAKMLVDRNLFSDISIAQLALPLCNINFVGAFALERELDKYLNIFLAFNPKSINGKLPARNFIYHTK